MRSLVVHEVESGWCRVCGELEEYLLATGAQIEYVGTPGLLVPE